jgi:hypothetical protein
MLVVRGATAHLTVSYDDVLPNGITLADTVLASCAADRTTLAGLWIGTTAPSAIQVTLVAGPGGASHGGSNITCYVNNNTDAPGIVALIVAEVDEIFMSVQKAALGKSSSPTKTPRQSLTTAPACAYPSRRTRWPSARCTRAARSAASPGGWCPIETSLTIGGSDGQTGGATRVSGKS